MQSSDWWELVTLVMFNDERRHANFQMCQGTFVKLDLFNKHRNAVISCCD